METPEKADRERQSRTRLTFAQKIEVLKRLENGEKQMALAKELGCSKRALSRLKQDKAFFQNLDLKKSDTERKSRHTVRYITLEAKLTRFLTLARRNSYPVTGSVVRSAARKIRDRLLADTALPESERGPLQAFQASINWSKAFIKRCGLRHSEPIDDESSTQRALEARRQMKTLLLDYDLECIVCVEKMNLFYKLLPNEMLAQSQANRSPSLGDASRKNSLDERVVVIAATNTTAAMLIPPTIVWKERTPRCFNGRPSPLPYLSHPQAWLDEDLFKTWFYSVLLPSVRRYTTKKVALVVDGEWVPSDIMDSQGQVTIVSLPASNMSASHALETGIMAALRRKYRYAMLEVVIRMLSSAKEVQESGFGKTTLAPGLTDGAAASLLDLADLLQTAWRSLPESFISRCWAKADVLPEQHVARLVGMFGEHDSATSAEFYAGACTEEQIQNTRALESVIVDRKLQVSKSASQQTASLVSKLNGIGRKGLDVWLDVEDTPKAQRALSAELDETVANFSTTFLGSNTPAKRTVEDMVTGASQEVSRNSQPLPSIGYLMDLLAPVQCVLHECESGDAHQILRRLKHELVRVKSDQDRQAAEKRHAEARDQEVEASHVPLASEGTMPIRPP